MIATTIRAGDEIRELYRELILDHARNPRHFGKLDAATHRAEGINPLCGDKLKLYLQLVENDRIGDASFEGSGCAISVASASLMTDMVIGQPLDKALEYFEVVTGRLTKSDQTLADTVEPALEKVLALDGVREFPSRIKCATLAWHALNSAIHQQSTPVSTE